MTDPLRPTILSDEQLVAYLDDQLDTEQRTRIDAAINEDPALNLRLQWLARSSRRSRMLTTNWVSKRQWIACTPCSTPCPALPARHLVGAGFWPQRLAL